MRDCNAAGAGRAGLKKREMSRLESDGSCEGRLMEIFHEKTHHVEFPDFMQCSHARADLKISDTKLPHNTLRQPSVATRAQQTGKDSQQCSPFPAPLAPACPDEGTRPGACLSTLLFPTRTRGKTGALVVPESRGSQTDAGNPPIAGLRTLHFQGGWGLLATS